MAALLSVAVLSATPAAAGGWPASVAGTWSVTANQTVGAMAINQPASAALCKPINGTILGSQLRGFYCPGSGRIAFHRLGASGSIFQYYAGNLSQLIAGRPLRIGGNFSDLNDPGEYSFTAIK
jgi:hypothetical protein